MKNRNFQLNMRRNHPETASNKPHIEQSNEFKQLVNLFRNISEGQSIVNKIVKIFTNKKIDTDFESLSRKMWALASKCTLSGEPGEQYAKVCSALMYVLLEDKNVRQNFINRLTNTFEQNCSATGEGQYFLTVLCMQLFYLQEGALDYILKKCDEVQANSTTWSHTQISAALKELKLAEEVLLKPQHQAGSERIQAMLCEVSKSDTYFYEMKAFLESFERQKIKFNQAAQSQDIIPNQLIESFIIKPTMFVPDTGAENQAEAFTHIELNKEEGFSELSTKTVNALHLAFKNLQVVHKVTVNILDEYDLSKLHERDKQVACKQITKFKEKMQQTEDNFVQIFILNLQHEATNELAHFYQAPESEQKINIFIGELQKSFKHCVLSIYSEFKLPKAECDKIIVQFDKSINSLLASQIAPQEKKAGSRFGKLGLFKSGQVNSKTADQALQEDFDKNSGAPGPSRQTG